MGCMIRYSSSRRIDRVAGILQRRKTRTRESQIWPLGQAPDPAPKVAQGATLEALRSSIGPAGKPRRLARDDDPAWRETWSPVDAPPTGSTPAPEGHVAQDHRDVLLRSVDKLDLSVKAANWLQVASILTIGELTRMTRRDLRRIRWSSARVIRCVVEALAEFGLSLAPDPSKQADRGEL